MNLAGLLQTPFPRPGRSKRNLLRVVLFGLGCSVFVIVFKPFGIQNVYDQWFYNLAILSIGLVFIVAYLFIEWLVPSLIPKVFQRWTLGRAMLWYALVILFVCAAMFLYKSYLAGFRDFT
ncbi:MAG: hypothetical protein AAGB22_02035, partial [Bacteroidota bacterium]